jgi:hypothetical protein
MMRQKLMYGIGLMAVLAVALVSTSYGDVVKVGDFEGNLDGWRAGDGMTLSFGATGATVGTQAMQVDGPGGWHIDALLDTKAHRATLANKGAKITADVTVVPADMTTTWMQVEMIINGQNNDDNGANNNIGWVSVGAQDVILDGQPHTYTWALPDALTGKIAAADDNIGWFELALVSNLDGASVTKFYIDNIQLSYDAPTSSVLVSSFEGGLDGWYTDTWTAGTIALSTTGATAGAQAMQVDGPGGWQQLTKVDVKPHLAVLANKGVKITADVTAFEADMTTTWMQVGMVINAQNNNDNGVNNNLGWNDLGLQDVVRDGQPHTLTWVLPDTVTGKIAGADDTIGWFEILLISNVDGASVAKFYIDNVQIVSPVVATGKSSDIIIGNFEQSMDGWAVGGGADVRYNDHNGVTLDKYSLDVYVPTGAWAGVLTMNMLDPNNAAKLAAFRANTKISADITRLVADWPVDQVPGWDGIHMIINCGGDGWSLWQDLGYQAGWQQTQGDLMQTATWSYAPYLSRINFDKLGWFSLEVTVNANDPAYTGWVLFYIDNIRLSGGGIALNPSPASGAKDVNTQTKLSWTAGAHATSHNLYLGTSSGAVAGANGASDPGVTFAQINGTSFDPNGLKFDTQYFWRVDAVNDASTDSPWKGPVWSFTTGNFLVVDDFESYTNDSPNRVFQTWIDGYGFSEDEFFPEGNAGNGSDAAVGHDIWTPGLSHLTIVETTTVHSGSQSMPLYYDNQTAGYSEATRTWAQPQDWTINGFNAMKLYLYGKADNVADPLYITLVDSAGKAATVTYNGPAVLTTEAWTEWTISLTDFTGVNVAAVTKMAIGVGSKTRVSKAAGMLLIDDIRIGFKPLGLVAYYKLEGNMLDSSGNGHDGTLAGDPNFPVAYVNGPTGFGKAMLFEGTSGHQYVDIGTFNPSAATGQLTVTLWAKWDGLTTAWQGMIGKRRDNWSASTMMWQIEANQTSGAVRFQREGTGDIEITANAMPIGQWNHIAVTFDGTTAKTYFNGALVTTAAFSFGFDREAPVQFGADTEGGGNSFNGALDEIRIYDKVLSEAEIKPLAGK